MLRSAASIVKVLGGVSPQPLLSREDMLGTHTGAGLVIVGSHTQKSTSQLQELLKFSAFEDIPFHSELVLEGNERFQQEIIRTRSACENALKEGKNVVIYTGRSLIAQEDDTPESALLRSVRISDGLQSIVKHLKITPAFLIAKGGITSSDIATKVLCVKRAFVMGQVKPGIPVWKTDAENLFPGIPYIIFPGNVGETSTLREIAEILTADS